MVTQRRAPATSDEEAPALVRVYPHPDLARKPAKESLPGVGVDGADVPAALAAEWIEAGLAVSRRPRAGGGSVDEGATSTIGENGPETIVPASPDQPEE